MRGYYGWKWLRDKQLFFDFFLLIHILTPSPSLFFSLRVADLRSGFYWFIYLWTLEEDPAAEHWARLTALMDRNVLVTAACSLGPGSTSFQPTLGPVWDHLSFCHLSICGTERWLVTLWFSKAWAHFQPLCLVGPNFNILKEDNIFHPLTCV